MGYSKHIYNIAEQKLSKKRDAARQLTLTRKLEIEAKIPEIAGITREIAQSSMAVTKVVIAGGGDIDAQINALKDKSLQLQQKRSDLLTSAGYPADYLAEQVACEVCGGGGYAGSSMCECLRTLLRQEAYAELSSLTPIKTSSFSDFSLDYYPNDDDANGQTSRGHMANVLSASKTFADTFSADSGSLLMFGSTGLGKTHLSLAIAAKVTELGFGVVYISVQKLMDKLETQKFSFSAEAKEQYQKDIDNVLNCDLLVLDDLGAEFSTSFTTSALYNIINSRYIEAKSTVISTNLELHEIEGKYGPRMLSRLIGGYKVLRFSGKDIRILKRLK